MGSVGANRNSSSRPDEFNGLFGNRSTQGPIERLTRVNEYNLINPNYGMGGAYRNNCALCSVAVALQARGYNVEAMPRDTTWRGLNSVFDIDYDNPDNFIASGSKYNLSGVKSKEQIYLQSRTYTSRDQIPTAPKGAKQVAKAIEDKVKKWGNGSVGIVNVKWKEVNSAHTINVINQNGTVAFYDGQTNKVITDLPKYLGRTIANHTNLVRVDNAPLKKDIKDLDKIVKRSNKFTD